MQDIDTVLAQIGRLPTLPSLALKVLELAGNPENDARELSRLITADPGLATRVLRVVNSAAFGVSRSVTSIHRAILLLGFHQVRSLCVGMVVLRGFENALGQSACSREDFWRHAVATAYLSRLLAQRGSHAADADNAFTGGLLHDIGILVVNQYLREKFDQVVAVALERSLAWHEAEQAAGGVDHAELGAALLRKWNLPPEICLPVQYHHRPGEVLPLSGLAAIVAAADSLCDGQGVGFAIDAVRAPLSEKTWESVRVSPDVRAECLALAVEAMKATV